MIRNHTFAQLGHGSEFASNLLDYKKKKLKTKPLSIIILVQVQSWTLPPTL